MKAYVVDRYKGPLTLADLPEPTVGDHDVLVDIHAASVNGLDAKLRSGEFKLLLPYKTPFALGHDLAGVVAQTGTKVTCFSVGDEVFGRARDGRIGTFAQRLAVHEDRGLSGRGEWGEERGGGRGDTRSPRTPAALAHGEGGRSKGKVVITHGALS